MEINAGGYLIAFSSALSPDLENDYFDHKTDIGSQSTVPVYLDHGQDSLAGKQRIGTGRLRVDYQGVQIAATLNMPNRLGASIKRLLADDVLSWSSGSAGHLVERERVGGAYHVVSWPIVEASLVVEPAGGTPVGATLKAIDCEEAFRKARLNHFRRKNERRARELGIDLAAEMRREAYVNHLRLRHELITYEAGFKLNGEPL